jgi:hypothetical protein
VPPPPLPSRLLSRIAIGLGTSSYVTRSAIELRSCFQGTQDVTLPRGLRVVPSLSRGALQRHTGGLDSTYAGLLASPIPNHGFSSTTPDERTTRPQRHLERRPPHLVRRDLYAPDNDLDLQPAVGLQSNTGSLVSWRPLAVPIGLNPSWRRPVWSKLNSRFLNTGHQWTVRWPRPVFGWRLPFATMSLANKHTSIGLYRPHVAGNGCGKSFDTAG